MPLPPKTTRGDDAPLLPQQPHNRSDPSESILPGINYDGTRQEEIQLHNQQSKRYYHGAELQKNVKSMFDEYDGSISPIWNCSIAPQESANEQKKKLIFVHVFKTAGSTFRAFFEFYGQVCHKRTAILIGCSRITSESIAEPDSTWTSDNGVCSIKKATNRAGKIITTKSPDVNNTFLQKHVDTLIGHLPFGVHEHWMEDRDDTSETLVEAQYITFFREPVTRYVSGKLYQNRDANWTTEKAIKAMKEQVRKEHKQDLYYKKDPSQYLLSPKQKEGHPKTEDRIYQSMLNLVESPMMVGIVERMSESLEMLQHLIDGKGELTKYFARLDPTSNSTSPSTRMMIRNKSKLSTSAIVIELEKDEDIMEVFRDFLKYEFRLYDFALAVQERQYRWLRQTVHSNRPVQ